MRWALFFLIVLASCSLLPPVLAAHGFTNKSIQGTWVFLATGMFPSLGSPDKSFALAGLSTFGRRDQCSLMFTINAGGTSWGASSTTCTFSVQEDGTGVLNAAFEHGPVTFPPLALFFVIVNDDEMLAIRTDGVVASGMFRRQVK